MASNTNSATSGYIPNNGILNDYTIRPKNLTQYTAFRGVTDFTQIGQFDQFETGYSFLSVIQMPKFMQALGGAYADMMLSFKHMLEFEFRGLDGLEDLNAETFAITDGINEQNLINKVNPNSAITVSMPYFERRGGLIQKFTETYLTGIKDKYTQAKTYHGLIAEGLMEPSYANEVFTMLYYVTDNTMLRLERAVLLCNMQLTKSEFSMYNSTRGEIQNKEISIEFTAFPVTGYEVDRAAKVLLEDITGVNAKVDNTKGVVQLSKNPNAKDPAAINSSDYRFGIMNENSAADAYIPELVDAINRA